MSDTPHTHDDEPHGDEALDAGQGWPGLTRRELFRIDQAWEDFFEGAVVDVWLQAVTPEHNEHEAAFLARTLDTPDGVELLDI